MNTQVRACTSRLEQHIPGPSTPLFDSGFYEYTGGSVDDLEIADEKFRNSNPKPSAVLPNNRYLAINTKENDDLTRIGNVKGLSSPKTDFLKIQSTQQKLHTALLPKPKEQGENDRSKTPKNTQGVLKQILSQTYYGSSKVPALSQNRKKAKASKINTRNQPSRIQTEAATRILDEAPQKTASNLFTKKKAVQSNLINSPLAFEFTANPGICSIGTVCHTSPCNNENREPNVEHKGHQGNTDLLVKNSAKTPNGEKNKFFTLDKSTLASQNKKNVRKVSPDFTKEMAVNKKITQEELVKKYEQEEMKECTFHPEISSPNKSRRNLQQFLDDQSNFEAMKQQKTLKLREEIDRGIIESQRVVPPEITERSRRLVEIKRREEGDDRSAHDRLYERSKSPTTTQKDLSNLGLSAFSGRDAAEYTFHPRIRARSQNLKREESAAEILYKDALRRQSKSSINLRFTTQSMGGSRTPFINKSSKKMIAHKLIKEFESKTQEYFQPFQERRFNYLQICEFLRSLRFLRTATTEDVKNSYFVHERTLLYDMWALLKGDQYNGINERNLLAMLLAVLGLNFPIPPYTPSSDLSEQRNALDTSVDARGKSTPRYKGMGTLASRRESQSPDFSRSYYSHQALSPNPVDAAVQRTPILKYYPSTLSPQNVSLDSARNLRSPFTEKTSQRKIGSYQIISGTASHRKQALKGNASFDTKANVSNQRSHKKSQEQHKSVMNLGSFQNENISFTDAEVRYISQVFEIFYLNRLHSTERKIKDYHNYSFTPKILKSSRKLADDHRERQLSDTAKYIFDAQKSAPMDGRLTHADLLIYQKFIQKQKLKERAQAYAKKELELCSFTPNILERKSHRSYRSVSPNDPTKQPSTPSGNVGVKRGHQLYSLSKSAVKKQDQTYVDWYDQKYGQECTFKPLILKQNKTFDAGNRSIDNIPDANKSIGRIKRGREEREFINAMKSRGTSASSTGGDYLPSFNCCLEKSASKKQILEKSASKTDMKSKTQTNDNSTNQTVFTENTKARKSTRQNNSNQLESYDVESISKNTSFTGGYKSPTQADYLSANLLNSRRNTQSQQYKDLNMIELMNSRKQSIQSSHTSNNSRDEKRESSQSEQAVPLLFVDVNFGPGNSQRLVVYPGDQADYLAAKFAKEYNLDDVMKDRLQMMLESQIGGVLAKINEEMALKQTSADRQSFGSNKNHS